MVDQLRLNGVHPTRSTVPAAPSAPGQARTTEETFATVLNRELAQGGLKFSAHAEKRLASRGIPLTPAEVDSLSQAVDRAAAKGARESLILVGGTAFVVSVRNRTVITAIDGPSLKENVFTNIDSAVIA